MTTDRQPVRLVRDQPEPVPLREPEDRTTHIRSDQHALASLGDGGYVAYVLVQMFKYGTTLLVKRWPQLR